MIVKTEYSSWSELYSRFTAAPIILRLYCFMVTLAVLYMTALIFLLPQDLKIMMRNYIPVAPVGYVFGIYFVYASIFSVDKRMKKINLLFGMLAPLILYAVFDYLTLSDTSSTQAITLWQIVWAIGLPVFWAGMLMTRPVTIFLRSFNK
jgi:hypothetical protein